MRNNQGRGRGFYRGGRSSSASPGRSSQRRNKSHQPKSEAKELKFHPQVAGKTHVASYATTKDAIEQRIQKDWKEGGYDVAQSLRQLELIDIDDDMPERQQSQMGTAADRKEEQAGFNILYRQ